MNYSVRVYSFCLFLSFGFSAHAQMGLEGFSSGRYEVRKSKQRRPASEVENKVTVTDDAKLPSPKASGAEDKNVKIVETESGISSVKGLTVTAGASTGTGEINGSNESLMLPLEKSQIGSVKNNAVVSEEPSLEEQAESLFSNKANEVYEFYREQTHPEDDRNNRVELDINPVVAYMDSRANYSFRQYQSFFNGLKIKSNIWFTPRIGISGQFMTSLAADLDSMDGTNSKIPAKHEYFDFGVNFRTFFGISRNSNSAEFSLLYSDNKMTVPNDNTSRVRLKSSGFGIGVKNRIPSSADYSWIIGGSFFPRLDHAETQTGAAITSGSSQESVRFGLDLGGEWKFNRQKQLLWNLNGSVERNLFSGAAQSTDPGTGFTPSNVSVTNALYMFSLGYRWGQ